ncbi:TetR/AcrR family transcriptional regulator [Lewinella cohaerens]|uniref:TetR/AcrR family transcriptional regulator n=1 Tax=Lewinella cohaerens TaxID=70995 RepID=UPI000364EC78|nr:TetR/AcrR family transcriptional regulator [Lewinella cohaerens]
MTTKKERILEAALELFAKQGFAATSTNAIAKKAGVSEGLLFKHFGNKQGLLEALLKEGEERVAVLALPIVAEENPQEVLRKYIELPFNMPQEAYNFWRLIFQLKWNINYDHKKKLKPIRDKLIAVFTGLGKSNPPLETEMLMQLIDSASIGLLQGTLNEPMAYRDFLLKKYLL